MTNCKNCGAVLHGNKCDYCKTEYGQKTNHQKHDFYSDPSMMTFCPKPPKQKITQEEFNKIFSDHIADCIVKRGKIYLSSFASAILSNMYDKFDLSDVDIKKPFMPQDNVINVTIGNPVSPLERLFKIKKGVKA